MTHRHQLILFSQLPIAYFICATVERCQNKLNVSFELTDPHNEVFWPLANEMSRQDFLWDSTCFEVFIGSPNQHEYFELNLSPSSAWNLYCFTDYRTPNVMPPVAVLEPALIRFDVHLHRMSAEIDLNALKISHQEIKLGLAAVIKTAGASQYFALQHSALQADFHDKRDWIIRLLPNTPEQIA